MTDFELKNELYNIASLLRKAENLADDALEMNVKYDILAVRRAVSKRIEDLDRAARREGAKQAEQQIPSWMR